MKTKSKVVTNMIDLNIRVFILVKITVLGDDVVCMCVFAFIYRC